MIVDKEYRREGSIWDAMGNHYGAANQKITFVSKDEPHLAYFVQGDESGKYQIVVPTGRYRVYVAWGKRGALFSQTWGFDIDIYGWSKHLDVGTDGQFDGGGMGRTNLKFNDEP